MDDGRILQLLASVGIILIVWNTYVLLSAADISDSISNLSNHFFWMLVGALLIVPVLIGRKGK